MNKKDSSKINTPKEKETKPEDTNESKDPNPDDEQGTGEDNPEVEESILPKWLTRYLQFRFDLLDRTGKRVPKS